MSGRRTRKHIWVFDNPRTRSHVFFRWLSTHPDLQTCYHPYVMPSHFGPESFYNDVRVSEQRRKVIEELSPESRTDDSYEQATAVLARTFHDAEAKRDRLLIADHCHRVMRRDLLFAAIREQEGLPGNTTNNATQVPDHLLGQCQPVFVIRDPVLAIPSFYAGMAGLDIGFEPTGEDMLLQTSLRYCRMIFDYFHAVTGQLPLVVDGEDITWRHEDIGRKLCDGLDLDVAGLRPEWDPTPVSERPSNPYIWRFTQDMHQSTGIRQTPSRPMAKNIDKAAEEWAVLYGTEVASHLRMAVEANADDYSYLCRFKI